MDTLATVLRVLRALVDAAFSTGGITDTTHTDLQAAIDGADPAHAAAAARAEYELTDAEQAELARLQAKQAAAPAPAGGSETEGFGG